MKKVFNLILSIVVFVLSAQAFAQNYQYSRSIKKKHIEQIQKDFEFLGQFEFTEPLERESRMLFERDVFTPRYLFSWLNNRVKYFYHDVDAEDIDYKIVKTNQRYPKEKKGGTYLSRKSYTMMQNLGIAFYEAAKDALMLVSLPFVNTKQEKTQIKITSPRVGILQVKKGLFEKAVQIDPNDKTSRANSLQRLATYFHEARHSDGNRKTLGFTHSECPEGHEYEGEPACDNLHNGSYAIEAFVLLELTKNCRLCTTGQKEKLKFEVASLLDRIQRLASNRFQQILKKEELSKEKRSLESLIALLGNSSKKRDKKKLVKAQENLKRVLEDLDKLSHQDDGKVLNKKRFGDARPESIK